MKQYQKLLAKKLVRETRRSFFEFPLIVIQRELQRVKTSDFDLVRRSVYFQILHEAPLRTVEDAIYHEIHYNEQYTFRTVVEQSACPKELPFDCKSLVWTVQGFGGGDGVLNQFDIENSGPKL